MTETAGRGWLGSVRRRVRHEIKAHVRTNPAMRRARYSWLQRMLRAILAGRSLTALLLAYLILDIALVIIEAGWTSRFQRYPSGWTGPELRGLLKDVESYLIAAQVGLLAVVSIAIGLVTLISERATDVRLYYVESFAYDIIRSSVALLIILLVQLLWPLQYISHMLGFGGPDLLFKVTATGVHLTWMVLNLLLFAQFVITALQFIEPRARERLRERYTANVIVPRDLSVRLSRIFYVNAPKELNLEAAEVTRRPITFGYGILDDEDAELETTFRRRSILRDIWLHPLKIALRSWWRRSKDGDSAPTAVRSAHSKRETRLAFSASFDGVFEGDSVWCRRSGGAPLNHWERWLIRKSFRFAPAHEEESDLPAPALFLDELADKIIAQIEQGAVTGFKSALDETLRYHRFLLDVHDTRSEEGTPLSLAEVGGLWEAPHQEWIRQYRRVFAKAADSIRVDTYFTDSMTHVISRLLPSDATTVSPAVVTSLLDLALDQVIVLEAWVTRRTTVEVPSDEAAQPRLQLAGSDQRAYDEVVSRFIGAWENVLRVADSLYGWKAAEHKSASDYWAAVGMSWQFLQRHLRNTAYLMALAVWNEDAVGAERFRDTFLRWLDTLRPSDEARYQLNHSALLTADLLSLEWSNVETHLASHLRRAWPQIPSANAVFGILVRNMFDDFLIVAATITLAWYTNNQQSGDIGARTATLLVRRQVIEGEGSRFAASNPSQKSTFRALFSLIIRTATGQREYGAGLDGLVQFLNGMSERRVVPGRIYSSWGWGGLDAIRVHFLAMLAAHLPSGGDDGVIAWIRELAANEDVFPDRDTALRRISSSLEAYARALGDTLNQALFERGVRVFAPDVDVPAARLRLNGLLTDAMSAIQDERTKRLRSLPIDADKFNALTAVLLKGLKPELYCFKDFHIHKAHGKATKNRAKAEAVMEWSITGIDKGQFVTPMMSWQSSNDFSRVILDAFRERLTHYVWADFFQRQRKVLDMDSSDYPDKYWQTVLASAANVGPRPIILAPYDPIGETITRCANSSAPLLSGNHQVQYIQGRASGGGTGYVGTVDDVDVFTADVEEDRSYLFSAQILRLIRYRQVAPDALIDVSLKEGDDPWRSEIVVRFAQSLKWRSMPIYEFILKEGS